MWGLLLVLLLLAGGMYKGWVSWKIIGILFVIYIIIICVYGVYMYRMNNFSSTKYIKYGQIVYKLKKVGQDPYFMADDGGSDYVILAGKVERITNGTENFDGNTIGFNRGLTRGSIVVKWEYVTQPRVGNKYLPIGTYPEKDFTWNLDTFKSFDQNSPLFKLKYSRELCDDTEVSTYYNYD